MSRLYHVLRRVHMRGIMQLGIFLSAASWPMCERAFTRRPPVAFVLLRGLRRKLKSAAANRHGRVRAMGRIALGRCLL